MKNRFPVRGTLMGMSAHHPFVVRVKRVPAPRVVTPVSGSGGRVFFIKNWIGLTVASRPEVSGQQCGDGYTRPGGPRRPMPEGYTNFTRSFRLS